MEHTVTPRARMRGFSCFKYVVLAVNTAFLLGFVDRASQYNLSN